MKEKRIVIWEYWQNPYGSNDSEFVEEKDAKVPENSWEDSGVETSKEVDVRPVVITPMGLFPIQAFRKFTEVFEFWIGHTNFHITKKIYKAIESCPGVEIFDVFSPYRFRISVGKAFNGTEVKNEILRRLNVYLQTTGELNPNFVVLSAELQSQVKEIRQSISNSHLYWAIYVLPNEHIAFCGVDTQEEYEQIVGVYSEALAMVGGVIYNHE